MLTAIAKLPVKSVSRRRSGQARQGRGSPVHPTRSPHGRWRSRPLESVTVVTPGLRAPTSRYIRLVRRRTYRRGAISV